MVNSSGIQAALYWLAFLISLILLVILNQSIDPDAPWENYPAPMSLKMVLLYTFFISSAYNVFLLRATQRYIKPQHQFYFSAGRLFDNSLFWLFAAYCLAKIYGFYQTKVFWFSWKTWTMMGIYLLLNMLIQKMTVNNKNHTH